MYVIVSGTVSVRDGKLCERYDAFTLGRPGCGHVYRNPGGSPTQRNELVYANPYTLRYFTANE